MSDQEEFEDSRPQWSDDFSEEGEEEFWETMRPRFNSVIRDAARKEAGLE